jgi:hypothetical protein
MGRRVTAYPAGALTRRASGLPRVTLARDKGSLCARQSVTERCYYWNFPACHAVAGSVNLKHNGRYSGASLD